jgi:hypothetical protein
MKNINTNQTTQTGLKVRTHTEAGGWNQNDKHELVRCAAKSSALKVKTHLKAGGRTVYHNQTLVRKLDR